MTVASAARDFADQYVPARQRLTFWPNATVTSVSGGVATVSIAGNSQQAAHLSSYTPTAGDQVAVLLIDGSPLILGKPTGFPSF